jgi:hypothetical protein
MYIWIKDSFKRYVIPQIGQTKNATPMLVEKRLLVLELIKDPISLYLLFFNKLDSNF